MEQPIWRTVHHDDDPDFDLLLTEEEKFAIAAGTPMTIIRQDKETNTNHSKFYNMEKLGPQGDKMADFAREFPALIEQFFSLPSTIAIFEKHKKNEKNNAVQGAGTSGGT